KPPSEKVNLSGNNGLRLSWAGSAEEIREIQELRFRLFGLGSGAGTDVDALDGVFRHLMVRSVDERLLGCCRLAVFRGPEILDGYTAQYYDLQKLGHGDMTTLELGRVCAVPGAHSPDVLRLIFGGVGRVVLEEGAGLLFGCSSFAGTDPDPLRPAFGWLAAGHLAPESWRPGIKAAEHVMLHPDLFQASPSTTPSGVPPILRYYLMMGGRVSDHAVIDRRLNTTHVFTGVMVNDIPTARRRVLTNLADSVGTRFAIPVDLPRGPR
ncbi:MAG: GNAT family N-acetyltransferase, partial [Paracoccaceae bacterium]|nr:GNAT family N-acetyltransferase [Paracoccaceae bacterium]